MIAQHSVLLTNNLPNSKTTPRTPAEIITGEKFNFFANLQAPFGSVALGKLVTEKPVDFVGFDNVVEFNKNRQNDDNVVKAFKGLFS